MKLLPIAAIGLFGTPFLLAQSQASTKLAARLAASTTLPITFTRTVNAKSAHAGDPVFAKTIERVNLADGQVIPSGASVTGRIVDAVPFAFDKTPYAKQNSSTLTIHFDSIDSRGATLPLNVYVRALADPITTWDAQKARPVDEDPDATTVQIGGGEIFEPHQGQVIDMEGDIVGYQHHGGIYAHLLPASGNSPEGCDGGNTEVAVALFSASACGLYGFTNVSMVHSGRTGSASTLMLSSRRASPEILKGSTALLEVLPETQMTASR
jgi:hypothetical protein